MRESNARIYTRTSRACKLVPLAFAQVDFRSLEQVFAMETTEEISLEGEQIECLKKYLCERNWYEIWDAITKKIRLPIFLKFSEIVPSIPVSTYNKRFFLAQ